MSVLLEDFTISKVVPVGVLSVAQVLTDEGIQLSFQEAKSGQISKGYFKINIL